MMPQKTRRKTVRSNRTGGTTTANLRRLTAEKLEPRQMLAADTLHPMDVNQDRIVSPSDALQVINTIAGANDPESRHDVNRDGDVTPIDALQIVNFLAVESSSSLPDATPQASRQTSLSLEPDSEVLGESEVLGQEDGGSAADEIGVVWAFPENVIQRTVHELRIESFAEFDLNSASSLTLDWGDGTVESIASSDFGVPLHRLKSYSTETGTATLSLRAELTDGSSLTLADRTVEVQLASPEVVNRQDQGLFAEVFDNAELTGAPTDTRVDPAVRFDFGDDGPSVGVADGSSEPGSSEPGSSEPGSSEPGSSEPGSSEPGSSEFSIRWRGTFEPAHAGDHTFFSQTGANDQIRLLLDGVAVIDTFGNPTETEQEHTFAWTDENPIQLEIQYIGGVGASSIVVGTESDRTFKLPLESERLSPLQPASSLRSGFLLERFVIPESETLADLRASDSFRSNLPSSAADISSFRSLDEPTTDSVGKRVRGFVVPPVSGAYTFHLAASSEAELFLSRGENSATLRQIAAVETPSAIDDFSDPSAASSIEIDLIGGQRYYIESLQLHSSAEVPIHLAVGWTMPGEETPGLIDENASSPVIPVVTLHANTSQTNESQPGQTTNRFYLHRSDDLGRDLEVQLTFGGTASSGLDYEAQTGSVIIPAGERSHEVVFETLADSIDEPDETIVVRVSADSGYQLGSESTRQIQQTIVPQIIDGEELLPQTGAPLERFDYVVNTDAELNPVIEFRVEDDRLPFVDSGIEPNAIRVDVNQFETPFDILFAKEFASEEIVEGEKYFASLWARSARDDQDARIGIRFQETETYAGTEDSWVVGNEWSPIYFPIVADFQGNNAAARGIDLRLGYREQTVEFAGFSLRHLPNATDLNSLPREILSYEGRSLDAAWRDEVAESVGSEQNTPTRIQILDSAGNPVRGAKVTVTPKLPSLPIGMSISPSLVVPGEEAYDLPGSERYRNLVDEYFGILTDGGEAQWGPWEEDPILPTDFFEWTVGQGKGYHGHAIIWGEMDGFPAPELLLEEYEAQLLATTPEEARDWLKNEVLTHVTEGPAFAFAGDRDDASSPNVQWWDAINHPILSRDIWEITGNAFMLDVLLAARSVVHPETELVINENRPLIDPGGERSDRLFDLLTELDDLADGNRAEYDSIGFQAHFQSQILPSIDSIASELERFRPFERTFQITEFDLDTLAIDDQTQADFSRDFYDLLRAQPDVTLFTPWGFWEGAHWRSAEGAHLFNADWTARPSGQLLLEQMATQSSSFTTGDEPLDVLLEPGQFDIQIQLPNGAVLETDNESICNQSVCEIVAGGFEPGRGILGSEISAALSGDAFLMYTFQPVSQRFPSLLSGAAEQLVLVRLIDGEWMFDNNRGYEPFAPVETDRLVASVDLASREVTPAEGWNLDYNGIRFGFETSDLDVSPDTWNGVENFGEFGVSGSYFTFSSAGVTGVLLGDSNTGVLGMETSVGRQGDAYLMHTQRPVQSRFDGVLSSTSDHLILVRFLDGQWVYDTNTAYLPFDPVESDRLVARIDLADRTVHMQKGVNSVFRGIRMGFTETDLVVTPNVWAGVENFGEFDVVGSYIDFPSETQTITANSAAIDVFLVIGQSNAAGRAAASELTNQELAQPYDGDLLYSKLEVNHSTLETSSTLPLGKLQPYQNGSALHVGPEVTLGRHLDAVSVNDAAVVSFVSGGTGIRNFLESGTLHDSMLGYFADVEDEFFLRGYSEINWNGIFVVTGEADTITQTSHIVFAKRLLELRETIQASVGAEDVPLIWSQLKGNWVDTSAYDYSRLNEGAGKVNEAVIDLAESVRGVSVTQSNADLDTRFSAGFSTGDGIHYSADAYASVGDRLFAAYVDRDTTGELATPVLVTPGSGIAATDNATGTGFLMYSYESVHLRFENRPFSASADHLIAVTYDADSGKWFYDNNTALFEFDPRVTDYLVAEVDFDANTVTSLEGVAGTHEGVRMGYAAGDLQFYAETFNGRSNAGEFWIDGGWIAQPERVETFEFDAVGEIKFRDDVGGIAHVLFSERPLTHPLGNPLGGELESQTRTNLIVVFFDESTGNWMADNGSELIIYQPASSDRIVAEINFDTLNVNLLRQPSQDLNGLRSGFAESDLSLQFQDAEMDLSLIAIGTQIRFFD